MGIVIKYLKSQEDLSTGSMEEKLCVNILVTTGIFWLRIEHT